jgi:hypothetical protein
MCSVVGLKSWMIPSRSTEMMASAALSTTAESRRYCLLVAHGLVHRGADLGS